MWADAELLRHVVSIRGVGFQKVSNAMGLREQGRKESVLTESVRKSNTSVQYRQAFAFPYLRWHSS